MDPVQADGKVCFSRVELVQRIRGTIFHKSGGEALLDRLKTIFRRLVVKTLLNSLESKNFRTMLKT